MIQRIQTLWLAFVILITVATFFFPIVDFNFSFKSMDTIQHYGLLQPESSPNSLQFIQTTPAWSLIFMQIGVSLIALIAIFLYNNRQLQVKLVASGLLLVTIYVAFLLFIKIDGLEKAIAHLYTTPIVNYNRISISFPILQLLLFILAQRAIRKDERIVRSSDRLR
ncbi:MAG: DUF4293 domain-containing protein [Bacteroidales bacterium]|nr:DUF4293 domain-containing protein [Bacteroidales bacterium]